MAAFGKPVRRRIPSRSSFLLASLVCASCSDATVVVGKFDASTAMADAAQDAGNTDGQARPPAANGAQVETSPLAAFCAGSGPAIRRARDPGDGAACTEPLERELFSYALCACSDLQLGGEAVVVDAFDSRQGTYAPGQGGAAVGVDGALMALAPDIQIKGSLIFAGAPPLRLAGTRFAVDGDARLAASIDAAGSGIRFARDGWFGGDIGGVNASQIAVGRNAYQAPGRTGLELVAAQGGKATADFAIAPPCPCAPDQQLDVAAIVAQARMVADNAAVGIPEDALDRTLDTRIEALPCGRIVLSNPTIAISTLSFTVAGRTALFIDGDFTISAGTVLFTEFAPLAELDLFISGDLRVDANGTLVLGNEAGPSALRLYVGGRIEAAGNLGLAAQVYAPRATIALPGTFDAYGSIVADRIATAGTQRLHYDRAVVDCSDGGCGTCAQDAECCAPLSCIDGACQPLSL